MADSNQQNIINTLDELKTEISSLRAELQALRGFIENGSTKKITLVGTRRPAVRAINVQWKDHIVGKDGSKQGMPLFQHMTQGVAADEWEQTREVGMKVSFEKKIYKIMSLNMSKTSNGQLVTIAESDKSESKVVKNSEVKRVSLWPFAPIGDQLTELEAKDSKVLAALAKGNKDEQIKIKANLIWSKIIKEDMLMLKWAKDYLSTVRESLKVKEDSTEVSGADQPTTPTTGPVVTPAVKKSASKPSAKKAAPKKNAKVKKDKNDSNSESESGSG